MVSGLPICASPPCPTRKPLVRSAQGTPWSIRVADVETKVGHEVWRSREGRGSVFRFLAANQQLFWTADDRLIFPWEGDGWTHLYSVPLKGGAATLMTPGEFEVENVALTPDRREVVFNSNQDDIDRRHLWREAANATKPMRVTGGEGIEWSPVITSDGQHIVTAAVRRAVAGAARAGGARWVSARPRSGIDAPGFSRRAVGCAAAGDHSPPRMG